MKGLVLASAPAASPNSPLLFNLCSPIFCNTPPPQISVARTHHHHHQHQRPTLFISLSSSSSSSSVTKEERQEGPAPLPSSPPSIAESVAVDDDKDPDQWVRPISSSGCKACGRKQIERGCNGEGRIQGGIATVPGFGWWPIKAYRPCPGFIASGGNYRRRGQSMDEVAFGGGRRGTSLDDVDELETRKGGKDRRRFKS